MQNGHDVVIASAGGEPTPEQTDPGSEAVAWPIDPQPTS